MGQSRFLDLCIGTAEPQLTLSLRGLRILADRRLFDPTSDGRSPTGADRALGRGRLFQDRGTSIKRASHDDRLPSSRDAEQESTWRGMGFVLADAQRLPDDLSLSESRFLQLRTAPP